MIPDYNTDSRAICLLRETWSLYTQTEEEYKIDEIRSELQRKEREFERITNEKTKEKNINMTDNVKALEDQVESLKKELNKKKQQAS